MADYDITYLKKLTVSSEKDYAAFGRMAKLDDTHFIIATRDALAHGMLYSVSIDANYDLTVEDSLEFQTTNNEGNSIVALDGTHFAVSCQGNVGDGFVGTYSVDANFDITLIDQFEFDTASAYWTSICQMDSTHLAVAYHEQYGAGYLKTFSMTAGFDSIALVDTITTHNRDSDGNGFNALVRIDSTHVILAMTTGDSYITTYSMDSSGDNLTEVDDLKWTTNNSTYISMKAIDDTHFAAAYTYGNTGVTTVFSINGSYEIAEDDSFTFETTRCYGGGISKIDGTHTVINWSGPDVDGFIGTYDLGSSLNDISNDDELEHNTTYGVSGDVLMIDDSHCVLISSDSAVGLVAKTFDLNVPVVATDTGFLLMF